MSERLYQLVNVDTENDLYYKTKTMMIHNEKLIYMLHEHQARVKELNTDIDSKSAAELFEPWNEYCSKKIQPLMFNWKK